MGESSLTPIRPGLNPRRKNFALASPQTNAAGSPRNTCTRQIDPTQNPSQRGGATHPNAPAAKASTPAAYFTGQRLLMSPARITGRAARSRPCRARAGLVPRRGQARSRKTNMSQRWYTVRETAKFLGLSIRSVHTFLEDGRLHGERDPAAGPTTWQLCPECVARLAQIRKQMLELWKKMWFERRPCGWRGEIHPSDLKDWTIGTCTRAVSRSKKIGDPNS